MPRPDVLPARAWANDAFHQILVALERAAVRRMSETRQGLLRATGETMETQTKCSNEALEPGATPAIPITCRLVDTPAGGLQTERTEPLNCCAEYKGYRLNACARPTSSELYAADLVIGRPGFPSRHFRALDHFYDGRQALRYATRWGRIWVDHHLTKNTGNVSRQDNRARQY